MEVESLMRCAIIQSDIEKPRKIDTHNQHKIDNSELK